MANTDRQPHLLVGGDVLAFGMALCMAIMMLLNIRQYNETPDVPAACISAPLSTPGLAVRLPARLLTIGGQMVSPTENALINTLETPLAVAWVWVCFVEVPTITSFAGGIIVMAAVAGHVWHNKSIRRARCR